uniref:Uncharacterized protein n=1 Tax=Rhizophora mucronata TaxID=61149 RepID=A0A2P2QMI7_RHIMU
MESLVRNNSADNLVGSLVVVTAALLLLPLMRGLRLDDINNLMGLPVNDSGYTFPLTELYRRAKPATKNKDASDIMDDDSQDYDNLDFSDEDDDSDSDEESEDYSEGGAYSDVGSSDDDDDDEDDDTDEDDDDSDEEEDSDEDEDGGEVDNPPTPKKTN